MMSKERELLEWALIFLHPDVSEEAAYSGLDETVKKFTVRRIESEAA
jgi:hypothetical protein